MPTLGHSVDRSPVKIDIGQEIGHKQCFSAFLSLHCYEIFALIIHRERPYITLTTAQEKMTLVWRFSFIFKLASAVFSNRQLKVEVLYRLGLC